MQTSVSKCRSRHVSFSTSVWAILVNGDAIDDVFCEPLRNPNPSPCWSHDANPCHTDIDGRTFHVPPVCATCLHHCDRFTMHGPNPKILQGHLTHDVRRTRLSSRHVTYSRCRATQPPQLDQPKYAPRPAKRSKHQLTIQVQPWSCRLDHESPIAEFASQLPNAPQQAGNNQNVPNPNPPMQPAFVDDLSTRFLPMGYDIFDGDFDVPVRTWYIDHATIRRWTAPRNLQLVGPPQGWEAQFSSIWVDQINPDEWFDVTVIHPDPPRSPRNSFLIMDLVITQSLQWDRFAGLVTVFPNIPGAFDMYSVAASFEPHVSGFEIALAADAADMCRYQECTVTFGWQDIPFTLRPHHVMANGDGFQVTIRHHPARLAMSSGSQAGSSTNSANSRVTALDEDTAAIPARQNDTMPANRFTTPLHLFQMEGHEIVMQLVNAQLAQPSHEMANALHVPLNCIEALHVMPIPPDGFPELAIPAIVQRVGDIDLHSMDRLILIDTIYHHHITEGVTNQPTVVRTVQRVTHQVTRQQILFKAAVYHYCQFLQEGCAVSLDGYLWPINHVDPRPVTHGSYATVDVPPPYGHNLDTQLVATQLHVDGTTDAMMTFLQEPDAEPEDTTFLTQLFAARTVVASTIKQRVRWCCRDLPLPTDVAIESNNASSLHMERPLLNAPLQSADHHDVVQQSPLRQITVTTSSNMLPTSNAGVAHASARIEPVVNHEVYSHDAPKSDVSLVPRQPLASDFMQNPAVPNAPKRSVQSSLHRFFGRSPIGPDDKRHNVVPQVKRTLYDFFKPAKKLKDIMVPDSTPSEDADDPLATGPDHTVPQIDITRCLEVAPISCVSNAHVNTEVANLTRPVPVNQLRCSASQEIAPPVFTTRYQVQQEQQQPGQAPRPAWRIHLANIFEELATVRHRETGPVMQVEVWYVHHLSHPECAAPRTVELDNIQELWYADLCNAWFDQIHRLEPMKVVNVLPNPPHQTRVGPVAHIILEQGFSPERVALHFTAVFLGGTRVGIFQRAESAPARICTRDMIVRHGFQLQCDCRPCAMHSGILRFAFDEPEEVFSGISAVLTVAPPPEEPLNLHAPAPPMPTAYNANDMEDDATSSMQLHVVGQQSATVSHTDTPNPTLISNLPPFDHRMPPAAITEFRETLLWQFGHPGPTCNFVPIERMRIRTWYLNSDTCIRTEVSRLLVLRPQQHTWHQDIIEAWRDRLDPIYPVHLHVVTPNPPGTSLELEVHVIVLQRPNPLWRSALLTVSQPRADPWNLQFICAMLDAETSLEQLAFISGVTHPSNPNAHLMHIEAQQGQAHLRDDCSFPVRHGYWFDIQAYNANDHWDDEVATIQLYFHQIKHSIGELYKRIPITPRSSMLPAHEVQEDPPPVALTAAVRPNDPGVFTNPQEALPFITALQAYWQPLALLQPSELPSLVPIVTWYIDHIRFPQCFQPRLVLLNDNPEDWIQRIRSVWIDLIVPQHIMHVHIVQPPPPEMPPHIAAHILVVQQPIERFRSVLISSYDSALPTEPPVQHASITPSPLAFNTLVALAYRDAVCNNPLVDCAAWVGDIELLPNQEREVIDGHSLVIAVHRHLQPIQQNDTGWDLHVHAVPGARLRPM